MAAGDTTVGSTPIWESLEMFFRNAELGIFSVECSDPETVSHSFSQLAEVHLNVNVRQTQV
jgi:hypothetical protein